MFSSPQNAGISPFMYFRVEPTLAPNPERRDEPKATEHHLRFLLCSIMTALSTSARSDLCSSCIRRVAGGDISQLWFPFHRQLRGKKKKTTKLPTTINVKLLDDIKGFGRKGNVHRG